jgi:hypothetical protein
MRMAASARDGDASPDMVPGRTRARDVVLVGGGERARAWLALLSRSARLRAVATVTRQGQGLATELPRYGSHSEAMLAHPAALFAIALPPRAALESALRLAESGRAGVVEAPLHDALVDADIGTEAAGVRVAHGWVTLPGLRAIQAAIQRAGGGHLAVEVAGLPEQDGGDLREVLAHAAALARALLPQATASAARLSENGALELDLAASSPGGGWTGRLRVLQRGWRIAVDVEHSTHRAHWSWAHDRERVVLNGAPSIAPRATLPGPVRALAQLLPDAPRGDGLVEAAASMRLMRSWLSLLPTPLPLGARSFRQSASIAQRRPLDVLGCLGLEGSLPVEGGRAPAVLRDPLPPEPFEVWAFRAGIKPVAFLTVRPDQVERTLALFGEACVERRDRRVLVESQDRWTDRRDRGEPRVELYIARDAALAARAAALQAEADPSHALRELGALLGYPACCVDAFARQDDRANNSRNRYYSQARTLAPSDATEEPWPWELNNLHTMIAPFYPCSYRCRSARAWARAALAELARSDPAAAETLRASLARPVLYFDHDHQLVFDGRYVDGGISYRAVTITPTAPPQVAVLAGAIGGGDRLRFDDRRLLVEQGGRLVLRLERTDPGLGFVAPFGVAPAEPG